MGFVNKIVIVASTEHRKGCQGCGLVVCPLGSDLCVSCEQDLIEQIDIQAEVFDLEAEVVAMWIDEELRKSGAVQ